jgi:RNA polymerase sigma-B factor
MSTTDPTSFRMSDEVAAGLIEQYHRSGDITIRNQVVEAHAWLARVRARRLMRRSESLDDLVQVAAIGVLKATERFDPSFGVMFRSFASITADGELRRYYRSTWRVRVPRSMQELALEVSAATDQLTASRHAAPTIADVAHYLDRPQLEVEQAMLAGQNHRPGSLDQGVEQGGDGYAPAVDGGFERYFDRCLIDQLLAELPDRLQQMVRMRYESGMTQSEIGVELGMSQVHVSRLLSRALATMRSGVDAEVLAS